MTLPVHLKNKESFDQYLTSLVSPEKPSNLIVKNGKLDNAGNIRIALEKFKGLWGKDRTNKTLVELEVIRLITEGEKRGFINRNQLDLIENLAKKVGLNNDTKEQHKELNNLVESVKTSVERGKPFIAGDNYIREFEKNHESELPKFSKKSQNNPKAEEELDFDTPVQILPKKEELTLETEADETEKEGEGHTLDQDHDNEQEFQQKKEENSESSHQSWLKGEARPTKPDFATRPQPGIRRGQESIRKDKGRESQSQEHGEEVEKEQTTIAQEKFTPSQQQAEVILSTPLEEKTDKNPLEKDDTEQFEGELNDNHLGDESHHLEEREEEKNVEQSFAPTKVEEFTKEDVDKTHPSIDELLSELGSEKAAEEFLNELAQNIKEHGLDDLDFNDEDYFYLQLMNEQWELKAGDERNNGIKHFINKFLLIAENSEIDPKILKKNLEKIKNLDFNNAYALLLTTYRFISVYHSTNENKDFLQQRKELLATKLKELITNNPEDYQALSDVKNPKFNLSTVSEDFKVRPIAIEGSDTSNKNSYFTAKNVAKVALGTIAVVGIVTAIVKYMSTEEPSREEPYGQEPYGQLVTTEQQDIINNFLNGLQEQWTAARALTTTEQKDIIHKFLNRLQNQWIADRAVTVYEKHANTSYDTVTYVGTAILSAASALTGFAINKIGQLLGTKKVEKVEIGDEEISDEEYEDLLAEKLRELDEIYTENYEGNNQELMNELEDIIQKLQSDLDRLDTREIEFDQTVYNKLEKLKSDANELRKLDNQNKIRKKINKIKIDHSYLFRELPPPPIPNRDFIENDKEFEERALPPLPQSIKTTGEQTDIPEQEHGLKKLEGLIERLNKDIDNLELGKEKEAEPFISDTLYELKNRAENLKKSENPNEVSNSVDEIYLILSALTLPNIPQELSSPHKEITGSTLTEKSTNQLEQSNANASLEEEIEIPHMTGAPPPPAPSLPDNPIPHVANIPPPPPPPDNSITTTTSSKEFKGELEQAFNIDAEIKKMDFEKVEESENIPEKQLTELERKIAERKEKQADAEKSAAKRETDVKLELEKISKAKEKRETDRLNALTPEEREAEVKAKEKELKDMKAHKEEAMGWGEEIGERMNQMRRGMDSLILDKSQLGQSVTDMTISGIFESDKGDSIDKTNVGSVVQQLDEFLETIEINTKELAIYIKLTEGNNNKIMNANKTLGFANAIDEIQQKTKKFIETREASLKKYYSDEIAGAERKLTNLQKELEEAQANAALTAKNQPSKQQAPESSNAGKKQGTHRKEIKPANVREIIGERDAPESSEIVRNLTLRRNAAQEDLKSMRASLSEITARLEKLKEFNNDAQSKVDSGRKVHAVHNPNNEDTKSMNEAFDETVKKFQDILSDSESDADDEWKDD